MNVPEGFRRLAAESGSAPDRVRERLLGEVRSRRPSAAFLWWPWAAAALAAAVFLGFILAPGKKGARILQDPHAGKGDPIATKTTGGRDQQPSTVVSRLPGKRPVAPMALAKKRPLSPAPKLTPFVALPGSEMMMPVEDARVVRVEVERGMLRELGFLGVEARDRSIVQADFILGQDGLARAVRFVRY
jgi:hypothetical protein